MMMKINLTVCLMERKMSSIFIVFTVKLTGLKAALFPWIPENIFSLRMWGGEPQPRLFNMQNPS